MWGLGYPISMILFPVDSVLPPGKSQQVKKIIWKDVIDYCHSYFHILHFTPLSITEISFYYHKTNLNKAYLISVFKSQENLLLNQCASQSDNSLQEALYKPASKIALSLMTKSKI